MTGSRQLKRTGSPIRTEVHLCDNYSKLLLAAADLTSRAGDVDGTILFIDDRLPLDDRLMSLVAQTSAAELIRVSDAAAVDEFVRFPAPFPGMLRRNLSWQGARPVVPGRWRWSVLGDRTFDVGIVYHPGFFLSKVLAGRCARVVMRDDGYANYVRHRVPLAKAIPRLLAGRPPRLQTWGEERWIDEIQVVRPDQLPAATRAKGCRITLADFMTRLDSEQSLPLASAFWDEETPVPSVRAPTALLLSQPIDQIGVCSTDRKLELYADLADRLRSLGYEVLVKPHPTEVVAPLEDLPHIPRGFPIEGWTWLGQEPFDLAMSLNSAALSDEQPTFARRRVQLVPPEKFYRSAWDEWPKMFGDAFRQLEATIADEPGPTHTSRANT